MKKKKKLAWLRLSRSNKKKSDENENKEIETTSLETKQVERNLSIPACKLLFSFVIY